MKRVRTGHFSPLQVFLKKSANRDCAGDSVVDRSKAGSQHAISQELPFLVALYRGILAIFLGFALLVNPDKSQSFLANFMGIFWLSTGLLVLRRDSHEAFLAIGKRTSLETGLVAVITGMLVITRRITERWVDAALLVQLLGMIIMLTGALHVWGMVRIIRHRMGGRPLAHLILGVFEVVLGGMLLISPLSYGPTTYLVAMIWALVGGGTIIGTTVYDRIKSGKQEKESSQP